MAGRVLWTQQHSWVDAHTDTHQLEEPATRGKATSALTDRTGERRRSSVTVREYLKHLAAQLK